MAKYSIRHLCSENNYPLRNPHLNLQRIDYNHGCAKLVLVEVAYEIFCTTDGFADNLTIVAMAVYFSDDPGIVPVTQNVYSTIKSIIDHGKQLDAAGVSQLLRSRGFCVLSSSEYEESSAANEFPNPFYGIEEIYGDPSTNHLDDELQ